MTAKYFELHEFQREHFQVTSPWLPAIRDPDHSLALLRKVLQRYSPRDLLK